MRAHYLSCARPPVLAVTGGYGQEGRSGCDFGTFFSTTPQELLLCGIYNKIAVALKGGAWREASMILLAQALSEDPLVPNPLESNARASAAAP